MTETITVVCHHMPSFNVDALTLEPIGCSYNGPAAITEPGGRQMSYGEWCIQGDAKRIEKVRAIQIEGAEVELRAIQAKIAELKNATSAEQGDSND